MATADEGKIQAYDEGKVVYLPDADGLQRNTDAEAPQYFASESPYYQSIEKGSPEQAPVEPRICGLRRKAFWIAFALVAVVLAAVIGGAVGGTLAHKNSQTSQPTTVKTALPVSSSTKAPAAVSTGSSTKSPSSSSTTSSAAISSGTHGIAENNCPQSNRTTYKASSGAVFTILCAVNWPNGKLAPGGGVVQDLGNVLVYSIEDCIERCIDHESCKAITYEANISAVFDGGRDGNCYFKNQTGAYFPGKGTTVSAGMIAS